MKKVLLVICVLLCLSIIPCNNVYCEEDNILDTWNPIKTLHEKRNYDDITDLKEGNMYEIGSDNVILNKKGLEVNVYVRGHKIISTNGSIKLVAEVEGSDPLVGYYYVAREYDPIDKSIYLLKPSPIDYKKQKFTIEKYYFLHYSGDEGININFEGNDIYIGKTDVPGEYNVFYCPFMILECNYEDDNEIYELSDYHDFDLYMNDEPIEISTYTALRPELNPYNEYFDLSYDLKTQTIVMDIKKSFDVEIDDEHGFINDSAFDCYTNLKIIGNGDITFNYVFNNKEDQYSSSAIYTQNKVIIGDENSNLSLIYNDLVDRDTQIEDIMSKNYRCMSNFIDCGAFELYNTSLSLNLTGIAISSAGIVDIAICDVIIDNSVVDMKFDPIYFEYGELYPTGIICSNGKIICNNSSLTINDACCAFSNYSLEDDGIIFKNSFLDINVIDNAFYLTNPVKFIYDNPYAHIVINQENKDHSIFLWSEDYPVIGSPINIAGLPKYMNCEVTKDDYGNIIELAFINPSFIFNNIENINEENINYCFNTENGVLSITNPSKPDYDFDGWYLDEDLTVKWQNNSIIDEPYDFVLYAKWNIKENKPSYVIPLTGIK